MQLPWNLLNHFQGVNWSFATKNLGRRLIWSIYKLNWNLNFNETKVKFMQSNINHSNNVNVDIIKMMHFSTKTLTIKLNIKWNYKNKKMIEIKKKTKEKLKINGKKTRNNTFLCKNDHFCVGPYSKLNNDAFDKWQNEKF